MEDYTPVCVPLLSDCTKGESCIRFPLGREVATTKATQNIANRSHARRWPAGPRETDPVQGHCTYSQRAQGRPQTYHYQSGSKLHSIHPRPLLQPATGARPGGAKSPRAAYCHLVTLFNSVQPLIISTRGGAQALWTAQAPFTKTADNGKGPSHTPPRRCLAAAVNLICHISTCEDLASSRTVASRPTPPHQRAIP